MADLDFSSMTKDEIEEYGREVGIELDKRHSKADLIDELNQHLEDEVEEVEVEDEVEDEVEEVEVEDEVEDEVEEVVEIEPLVEDIPEIEVDQDSKLDAARTQATHHILSEHIKGGIQVSAASHERVETLAKQIHINREKAEKNSQKVLEKLAKEEQ
jgi:hypothetical protein|tara:strand:- start:127 stop:597 length:471 start_codon:yes stop_codon:yes gene_type:complete